MNKKLPTHNKQKYTFFMNPHSNPVGRRCPFVFLVTAAIISCSVHYSEAQLGSCPNPVSLPPYGPIIYFPPSSGGPGNPNPGPGPGPGLASGQSAFAVMVMNSADATRGKIGYTGCAAVLPPHYFLVQTTVRNFSYDDTPGITASLNETTINEYDDVHAYATNEICNWVAPILDLGCSGTNAVDAGDDENYIMTITDNNCDWSSPSGPIPPGTQEMWPWTEDHTGEIITTNCVDSPDSSISTVDNYYTDGVSLTRDMKTTFTFSNPYTDDSLRSDIIGMLGPLPDLLFGSPPCQAWWQIDSIFHACGSASEMEYTVGVLSSVINVSYLVQWNEVTTYPDGSSTSVPKYEYVVGTGDPINPAFGAIHVVAVPTVLSVISETSPTATVAPPPANPGD